MPQNSRFEVKRLPYLLIRLPFAVRYVWIDLLCIPQHHSRREFEAIKRQEISRQASVFSGVACAMAWLNDIENWQGLHQALEWLSICYFKLFNSGLSMTDPIHNLGVTEEELDRLLNSITSMADMSIGLYNWTRELPQGFLGLADLSSWFFSLWTLQEAFQRPDMLVCNGKVDVLTASGGFHVTFDMIKALVDAVDGQVDSDVGARAEEQLKLPVHSGTELSSIFSLLSPSTPRSVFALSRLRSVTRLWNGMQNSSAVVLNLASSRHCSARRAEAITSLVGAIDWYQSKGAAGTPSAHSLMLCVFHSFWRCNTN